jgi:hypothetical protein
MKILARFISVSLLLVLAISISYGWGNATHMYFSKQLGVPRGHLNYDEMYGSVLTDAFNLILDDKGFVMSDIMHHNFMPFVQQARTCGQKAAVFGVASHNDNWGADWFAHHSLTTGDLGYAESKGLELVSILVPEVTNILNNARPPLDPGIPEYLANLISPELGHDLAETAVDLCVKRGIDQYIGLEMVQAAKQRSSDVGQLLAETYAGTLASLLNISPVEAKKFILNAERANRDQVILYGRMFVLPEEQAIRALAVYNAAVAEGYLEATLFQQLKQQFDITVSPTVVEAFIRAAICAVQDDYVATLTNTLDATRSELLTRGITSCANPAPTENSPPRPLLSENFPNPFNPSTTISFRVPSTSVVSLDIYNIIGQKVRTLIDARTYEDGEWAVEWDGTSDSGLSVPSGTYISRLTTPSGVFTRKMQMVK